MKNLLELLSCSKKEFTEEYRKTYFGQTKAKDIYIQLLTEIQKSIEVSNFSKFKKLCDLFEYISDVENKETLKIYYNIADNPIQSTNLLILTCKHNTIEILKYLLENDNKILSNLSTDIGKNAILPTDVDETCRNAFYYALTSCNTELFEILIDKWPGDYFTNNLEVLDEMLSKTYEEINVKNISLTDEIQIAVESRLINLRFFSNNSDKTKSSGTSVNNVKGRIKLLIENVYKLKSEYSSSEKQVDEKFVFTSKFIAQNIHILKNQLKYTYDRLPWEEIEFCLICFISSYTKQEEINLFYLLVLSKDKILNHLENFANCLEKEMENINSLDINNYANLSKFKRTQVMGEIIKSYPHFEELYNNYQQIRDVHSLMKISSYIELVLLTDSGKKEGQLIITRTLQVFGECLKNTLESPKLSTTTSEYLLLSMPKNSREILINLRNSISHGFSLSKITEIEENSDIRFFTNIQNDIKKINIVINKILLNIKTKVIRKLLNKIVNNENLEELKEISRLFNNFQLDKIISATDFQPKEHETIEKLIGQLNKKIGKKTIYEEEQFIKIIKIIAAEKSNLKDIETNYEIGFSMFQTLNKTMNIQNLDCYYIRDLKNLAESTLKCIAPKIKPHKLQDIAKLVTNIANSIGPEIEVDDFDGVYGLISQILCLVQFEMDNIKWIEELRDKLNESIIPGTTQKKICNNLSEKTARNLLASKLSELKSILNKNALNNNEQFTFYKDNKKLQLVIEMLVLDIMSILGNSKKYLANNLISLDENSPLLTGKCLRNHLAHHNALIDVLFSDPLLTVLLNAQKLTVENLINKTIGKLVKEDVTKLEDRYNQGIIAISNQEEMFNALKEGNMEGFKHCIQKGADIHARSLNLWTALHFAAMGTSLEAVKYLLNNNLSTNVEDLNGQTALHIAATYGRNKILQYFIEELGLNVDSVDKNEKTCLHLASYNGHIDTVKVLLKNKSNPKIKDTSGMEAFIYAIQNNHKDIVKLFLDKKVGNVEKIIGGFTPLHMAAERGHLEIFKILLQYKADINAKNDRNGTPLHLAANNGNLEILNILISKGVDVNAKVLDGCTPLHYAVDNGNEEIVRVLLKHGANPNVIDRVYKNAPLHNAAKDGKEELVKLLLDHKAKINLETYENVTPLQFAVKHGHLSIVNIFLKLDVNINAKVRNNTTLLHLAAFYGQSDIIDILIKNKASIEAKDDNGLTPLHEAARNGHKEAVEVLLRNKAKVNAKANDGFTSLHAAALFGFIDVIDVLMKNGANVNAKDIKGCTPIAIACLNGLRETVDLFIKNKAEVNVADFKNRTPLLVACENGHKDVVSLLIQKKAEVNAMDDNGDTPLHRTIETSTTGAKEVIDILLRNKADINLKNKKNITPLITAIKHNHKEFVTLLIEKGANINSEDGLPLMTAVYAGYRDIVKILIKNNADVNIKSLKKITPLHAASKNGHAAIVNDLITKGAHVNAKDENNTTPLFYASFGGHKKVAEALLENGANINYKFISGKTALHIAANEGHISLIKVLLNKNAKINIRDDDGNTAVEYAVAYSTFEVTKLLLQHKDVNIKAKGDGNYTLLQIAAQEGKLETVSYLIERGADIHAKNMSGSKAIHIAAREGKGDIVKLFLAKGLSINEFGTDNQTLLHYAAMKGHLDIIKFLIEKGADVNATDLTYMRPLHFATRFGYKDIVKVLIDNGAIYNAAAILGRTPLELITSSNTVYQDKRYKTSLESIVNSDLLSSFASTDNLFQAISYESDLEVENCIKKGAYINAKNSNNVTPLHLATSKGFENIVDLLLKNDANPNVVGMSGSYPLHYAAKQARFKIVNALLSHGAIYNATTDKGNTPYDLTEHQGIKDLLRLVEKLFQSVQMGNCKVFNDLKEVKDISTMYTIMNAQNKEQKTLIVAAIHNNFPEIEQLKSVLQINVASKINNGLTKTVQGKYQEALNIFKPIYEKRKEILGPNNPGTLDIQSHIGRVMFKLGSYTESLNLLKDISKKQSNILGANNPDTLNTDSMIALVLHMQGKNKEAINIFQHVYNQQKELLGASHFNTVSTQFNMALALDRLEQYEEALLMNQEVYEIWKKAYGDHHKQTVSAQNNIALVLFHMKKYEEALKGFNKVLIKKKQILGENHPDTQMTLNNIAAIYKNQKNYKEALKTFNEVLKIQKKVLGPNHIDALNTQANIAGVLSGDGNFIGALKIHKEISAQRTAILGPFHPDILASQKMIATINTSLSLEGNQALANLQDFETDIKVAARNGDKNTVQFLLDNGTDVNENDSDGRTALHYSIDKGHNVIVNILLTNGADVTKPTKKGNTPLHTATSKGIKEIVDLLLRHVSHNKMNDFINTKTTVGGSASLHVAAINGSLEIVKCLLKHGAIYNIKNKEGKTPFDLSKNPNVINLLTLINTLFQYATNGNPQIMKKLENLEADKVAAITNCRNSEGNSITRVLLIYNHKDLAKELLKILK